MTTHEYQSAQGDLEKKVIKLEAISASDPARIDLTTDDDNTTKQLDIFIGSPDALAESAQDDPGRFVVVDLKDMPRAEDGQILYDGQKIAPDVRYLMIQPASLDWEKSKGYKGIRPGKVIDMGRRQEEMSKRFNFPPTTSANHFTIAADAKDGSLLIEDHNSTNGTAYRVIEETAREASDEVDEVTKEHITASTESADDIQLPEQLITDPVIEVDNTELYAPQEISSDVEGDMPEFAAAVDSTEQEADEPQTNDTDALEEIKDTYDTDEALLQAARAEYKNQIQRTIDEFNEAVASHTRRVTDSLEEIEGSVSAANQVYDTSLNDLSQLLGRLDDGSIGSHELNVKLSEIQNNIGYVRTRLMRTHESFHDVRRIGSSNEDIDNYPHLLVRKQAEFTDFMSSHGQEIEPTEDTVVLRNQMNATQEAIQEALGGLRTSESSIEDMAHTLTKALGIIAEIMARPSREDLGLLLRMLQSLDVSPVKTSTANVKSVLEEIRGISNS